MKLKIVTLSIMAVIQTASAVEITVQNDSLTDFGQGAIQSGFVAGEIGATWLTAPCDGVIVAAQVFWRSLNGGTSPIIHAEISISEAGVFPEPGTQLEAIIGPVLNDGVFNEYRFLDENSVIPLIVPVTEGEEYVLGFQFDSTPISGGPSLITDVDGCQAGKNAIFATPPNAWFDSCLSGVSGDFVIRAVVECPVVANEADLMVSQTANPNNYTAGQDLTYQITVSNAGPAVANAATLVDFFPASLSNVDWLCTPSGGASCGAATGSGNITLSINLPANSDVVFEAVGNVLPATTGIISNTAQVVVPVGLTDPNMANNTSTLEVLENGTDLIFADDFE